MTAREESLVAREILLNPGLLGERLVQRRWSDVAAAVRYARRDVPEELAATDPALYAALREGVTRFFLRGGGKIRLERLEELAARDGQAECP
jgi:hypothetical protein